MNLTCRISAGRRRTGSPVAVFASSWSRKLRPFEFHHRRRLKIPGGRRGPGRRRNRWVQCGGVVVVVVVELCDLRDAVGPAAAGDGDAGVESYVVAAAAAVDRS